MQAMGVHCVRIGQSWRLKSRFRRRSAVLIKCVSFKLQGTVL